MHPLVTTTAAMAALLLASAQAGAPHAAAAAISAQAGADSLTLPPPKAGRTRPLVVVVAENRGAETTDFIIPYGVLKDSGVADVRALSTGPGAVRLMMSLTIAADQTLAQFDAAEPAGADVVIVPAQIDPKDQILTAWVAEQARQGAVVMSVCEGARVLADAGLFKGRRATSHWHSLEGLAKAYPETAWVRDRRFVQDGPVISTTGVSASIPASLALVEAIGGRSAAQATAGRLGVSDWSADHRTSDYGLTSGDYAGAVGAMAAVWSHETVEAPLADGVDEIALALKADTWGRSFRTKVVTTAADGRPIRSKHGLVILPGDRPHPGRQGLGVTAAPPAPQLDLALDEVTRRYGARAGRLARLGLEYDGPGFSKSR